MSDALDEGLVQRIDARGTIEWSETCYRYTGAGGVGLVVTAYEQRTRPGQLQLRQSVDLTPALYQELRAT